MATAISCPCARTPACRFHSAPPSAAALQSRAGPAAGGRWVEAGVRVIQARQCSAAQQSRREPALRLRGHSIAFPRLWPPWQQRLRPASLIPAPRTRCPPPCGGCAPCTPPHPPAARVFGQKRTSSGTQHTGLRLLLSAVMAPEFHVSPSVPSPKIHSQPKPTTHLALVHHVGHQVVLGRHRRAALACSGRQRRVL